MQVRLRPKDELEAEAQAFAATVFKATDQPAVKVRNESAVLDLGNLTFFIFQGRAYGVPPVPYKAGYVLQKHWMDASAIGTLTPDTVPRYNAIIAQLPGLLWRQCQPVGRVRRFLKRLGLHRNPFTRATERELIDLTAFFLERRMMSSVKSLPAHLRAARATS